MTDYALTNRAGNDLFEIALYGYERFGARQAEAYAAELEHVFQLLAENPRTATTIACGVRRHEHGSHVILYEEVSDGVLVLAILSTKVA